MTAELYIDALFGTQYLRVPKIAIKAFGGARALFFSYLYNLSEFSQIKGEPDFFATRQKVSADLGFSERVCDDYFKFFKENGVIIGYRKGIADPKKYYKFDKQRLKDLLCECDSANADSACASERKICDSANADSACAYNKNKESIKTESIKTNSAKQNFDFEKFARELFENAKEKPKVSIDWWLDFVKNKAEVLKRKRKAITEKMIKLNFNELYKLQEISVNLRDRLEKAIIENWQGIFFDSDRREWNKRGGHFRNNVGHLDYDNSEKRDNPLSAIETHIQL